MSIENASECTVFAEWSTALTGGLAAIDCSSMMQGPAVAASPAVIEGSAVIKGSAVPQELG